MQVFAQIESLKSELGRREVEICRLKTHNESLTAQGHDREKLATLLREQVHAKEEQCTHMQHDVSECAVT